MSRMNIRMMTRTLIALACLALFSAAAPAQRHSAPALPIMGDDGRPVLNHRFAAELKGAAEKLPGAVVAGNPNGDVTLVEFYDLNCPFCRSASVDVDAMIATDKKLKLVLVPFPVLGVQSIVAGRVELAVAKTATPEQFYSFHRKVYEGRGVIDGERALAVVRDLKLDEKKILTLGGRRHDHRNDENACAARQSARVAGDAGLRHRRHRHPRTSGPNSLKYMINSMRRCGKPSC